jgi:hypothetical protein
MAVLQGAGADLAGCFLPSENTSTFSEITSEEAGAADCFTEPRCKNKAYLAQRYRRGPPDVNG